MGDVTPKRYVDEGIGGSRAENKAMRGQISSEMLKRNRG